MIQVESPIAPGSVAWTTAWHPRYWQFHTSLNELMVPVGTHQLMAQGHSCAEGTDALLESIRGDWIWLLPDDHGFARDALMRLLNRQRDVIAPYVCVRTPPWGSVGFKRFNSGGDWEAWGWDDIRLARRSNELLPCEALGGAGLLITKRALDKVDKPWFNTAIAKPDSPDTTFTSRLFKAGVKLWLDPCVGMSHLVDTALMPELDGEEPMMGLHILGKVVKVKL